VVAIEVADLGVEVEDVFPRGGDHHGRGMPEVAAPAHEQLECFVEDPGIRACRIDHGPQQFLRCKIGRPQVALSGSHQRDVAADRVDLAVVPEEPERLRALPRRSRVRREPLMEDGEPRVVSLCHEVRIERAELVGRAQSLVDDRAERERRDVEL
jgi:hypothetical protein